MAPKSTPEEQAERLHCAQELGLPPDWCAKVYTSQNNDKKYKFWDPSGNRISSLGELAATLGTLPEGLQRGQEAEAERLQCAQELGLPPGWRAKVYTRHNYTRTYHFWDPSGVDFWSLGKLAEVLGSLPEALQSKKASKPQAARTEAHEGGRPRSIDLEEEAERLQCAEELGLPPDRRAKPHTKPNNRKAAAEEATSSSAPRHSRARSEKTTGKGAERMRYAQELGLPEGWGAVYYKCGNYKFWDPSGAKYENATDLAKALGSVPAGLTRRRGETLLSISDGAMEGGDGPAGLDAKGETEAGGGDREQEAGGDEASGIRAGTGQAASGDDPDAGSARTQDGPAKRAKKGKLSVARAAKRKASPDSPADAEPRAKGRKKVLAAPVEVTAEAAAPAPDASAVLPQHAAPGSPSSSSSSSSSSLSEDSSDSDSVSEEEPPRQEPKIPARSAAQPVDDAESPQPLAQSEPALPAKAASGPAPAQPQKPVLPEPAKPAVVVWEKHWSPEFNIPFWWNRLTDESVWEPPPGVD